MKIQKFCVLLFTIFISQINSKVLAQIKPDRTLGNESSTINSIDELRSRIEGGAIRGENLFHSFEKFSIREGQTVYFANPEEISNIFSRVTGNNISEIFGTLGVEGAANLFLINPNGIVFGENAAVDVGGSFLATTAEKVYFENGTVWNIRDRSSKPKITYHGPIGLGLEETSGTIIVRGSGHNLVFTPERLPVPMNDLPLIRTQVSTDRNFALIGNKIEFDGGVINLLSKKIEIGSVRQG